ncbi:MAG: exo-alpha-sialidase [Verrucomicrobiae bacterium]|nr:exo-alpha-sialidase [Verrucomicrobiae bacterium]
MKKLLPFLLLITLLSSAPQRLSATDSPPNIIFLLADDLGYGDLGCYGQELIETPHLDRLAAEGIRFTQAYAGGPVCTSSRSVLMSGLHNGHTPARDNVPHYPTYFDDEDVTVAEVLKQAGYHTGGIGKWSLGDPNTPGRATNQGFDDWFGYLNQDHAHYYWTEYLDDNEGRRELPNNAVTREHYSHDLLAQHALKFIRQSAKTDAPFFYYSAFTLPHFSSKDEDPDGWAVPSTDPFTDREWPEKAKKYAAMVHRLDESVGEIVALVDELGLRENTLIIFSSDNGGHSTVWKKFHTCGPLRGFKRDLTEGGIRVPFIARWPGTIPAGSVSDEVIGFEDMLPTFAELAGTIVPKDLSIDGISVTSALKNEPMAKQRDFLYRDYGHCRRYYDQCVRLGDWKGIRLGKDGGKIQLYDLSKDIGETSDLAATHPEVVSEIANIMDTAVTPNARYPIGEIYRGDAIWRVENYHPSRSKLPPLTQPGEGAWESAEFLFNPEEAPTPSCHSSTLVELPDGQLAAAWFGGTSEPDIDNSIWFTRRVEEKWLPPVAVVDGTEGEDSDHRTGNPVLFQTTEGPLLLFYKVVPHEPNRASSWWGMMTRSDDGGKTWAEPWKLGENEKLGSSPHLIGPVKNKAIQLADGAILCPSSTEHDGWRVHFEITRDLGKTWEVIGPINDASNFNAIQPSLLFHSDQRWQVLCRSKESVVAQAWSEDGGKTWGPFTATSLPNPNSGTDAITLADGRHLIIYNHTLKRAPFPANRQMLNIAISEDGKKWTPVMTLEKEERSEFSYPYVIQTRDGKVHFTWTWKRKTIRHAVIDPGKL